MNTFFWRPSASTNRVHDVAVVTLTMLEMIRTVKANHRDILEAAAPQVRRAHRGDDPIDRLLSDDQTRGSIESRAGHYAIQMTWDAYQAALDDSVGYIVAWKERAFTKHAKVAPMDAAKFRNELEQTRRRLRTPEDFCSFLRLSFFDVKGGHERAADLKQIASSVKRLRDHLTHGLGHIDHEWLEKDEFAVWWFKGITVGKWQREPPATLPKLTKKRFKILPGTKVWAALKPAEVEGIIASIVILAQITVNEVRKVYKFPEDRDTIILPS